MSVKSAEVYIATTKGLVGVSSINELPDNDLRSVATINASSTLAGISLEYASFVHMPQGIIQRVFKKSAYRIDFTQNIDRGSSWQLGVYIAHYLYANNLLAKSQQVSYQNDSNIVPTLHSTDENNAKQENTSLIFIATGSVNTLDNSVMAIDALAKKCSRSKYLIEQWQKQQKSICFLVPSENMREAVADSPIRLTPISHLRELNALFEAYNLPLTNIANIDLQNSLPEDERISKQPKRPLNKHAEPVIIDAILQQDTAQSSSFVETQQPKEQGKKLWLAAATSAIFLFITTLYFSNSLPFSNETQFANTDMPAYIHLAYRSQNRSACQSPGLSILSAGKSASLAQLVSPDTMLNSLCQLTLISESSLQSLWMVTDSKAIIELDYMTIDSQSSLDPVAQLSEQISLEQSDNQTILQMFKNSPSYKVWFIPLPENQSITRQYHLLASTFRLDAADKQSLDSQLFSMHQQSLAHKQSTLLEWASKTQDSEQYFIIGHNLAR